MAATNYTPIQLYFSTTASAVPLAANLAQGELAINITDGKLYYEDNAGVVQVIATKGAGTIGGSTTQIQYNNAGALAGNAAMTFNSGTSTTTLTTLNLTNALGATYGGTAQSAYAQGDFLYASATNTLSKLSIGTVNYILTSSGSVPQWSAPSSIIVQTATNLAGGAGGSVPYQSAVDTTTFLAIGAANRVMTSSGTVPQWVTSLTGLTGVSSSSITNTSLTSGRVVVSTTGGAQADDADLTFDGTTLSAGGYSTVGLSTLVKTVKIGDSNFSGVAVFAAATPAKLYIGTGTVTDTTSAIGATNAVGAISSLAITPIAATNTSVTYTNASTLYIAGAPSAGTNVTLTNPYSLYIAAGNAYFGGAVVHGGNLDVTGNLTVNGNTTLGDAGTDSVQVTGYMGVGGSPVQQYGITIGTTNVITGSTTAASIRAVGTLGSGVTVNGSAINANVRTDAAAFTMALGATFYAQDATKGAGSTITNLHGLYISDQTQGTNNYGITSLVSSGTNKFNIYASGTAANYFAGNTGLGVVPNANWTDFTVLQNQQAAILGYDGQTHYTQNAYYQSGTWKYISASTFPATRYTHSSGIHYWFNATAGAANSAIAWTQGMTLTAASNLLVGTTNNNYSASIVAASDITTNWSSTIALRYNVSGQTTNYYKGMAGVSLIDGQARGLHIFNYDGDSNVGINFYPNNYAGQTATAAVTIASTGVMTSNYGQIVVTGTGSRGVRLTGLGSGEVAVAGDGATYAIGHSFYNTTTYATTLGGMFAYTAGGTFQYLAMGPSYNSSSSLYVIANGNVGVGFSAPATKLDVNGTIRLTPNSADTNYTASIYGNYNSAHPFQIDVKNNGSTAEYIGVYADGGGGNERVCFPTGNVLIGATAGSNKLLVVGTGTIGNFSASGLASSATVQIQAANGTGYNARLYMECPGVNSGGLTYTRADSRLYAYSQTDQSGPYVSANGTSWTTNSDRRLKTNIEDIGYGLASVMALAPKKYNYISNTEKQCLGLIAQDVANVIPEIVDVPENPESMMGIEYQSLVPVLVKAIQEQQAIIELLKARLDAANL